MRKQEEKMKKVRASAHLSTGVITISVIERRRKRRECKHIYAHIHVKTCNMLTIELMPTLSKLTRVCQENAQAVWIEKRERKNLVDQLESHVRPIATIESNCVMYFSNKQYLHGPLRSTQREKKEMTIDRYNIQTKRCDNRFYSYEACFCNVFDVSMNVRWINMIRWNEQTESDFVCLPVSVVLYLLLFQRDSPEFICRFSWLIDAHSFLSWNRKWRLERRRREKNNRKRRNNTHTHTHKAEKKGNPRNTMRVHH
jgi:hypothetical protein